MIKVFIGTNSNIHQKAEKVIEYSIRKNTSLDIVYIEFIRPGWKVGPTGFTTHRFLVPEMCNYEDYAIYFDVDMLILGDVQELWNYRTPGKWCITRKTKRQIRDEVSVIDCSAFNDLPKESELRKKKITKTQLRNKVGNRYHCNIPNEWNSLSKLDENTKLFHYTNLKRQPWKPSPRVKYLPHPNQEATDLFFQYLKKAENHGY